VRRHPLTPLQRQALLWWATAGPAA
jgi:hypothetical protein